MAMKLEKGDDFGVGKRRKITYRMHIGVAWNMVDYSRLGDVEKFEFTLDYLFLLRSHLLDKG